MHKINYHRLFQSKQYPCQMFHAQVRIWDMYPTCLAVHLPRKYILSSEFIIYNKTLINTVLPQKIKETNAKILMAPMSLKWEQMTLDTWAHTCTVHPYSNNIGDSNTIFFLNSQLALRFFLTSQSAENAMKVSQTYMSLKPRGLSKGNVTLLFGVC